MKGFTYLVTDGLAYKIGETSDLKQRLRSFNSRTEVYRDITIVAYCENGDRRALERKLHTLFSDQRIKNRREWFYFSEDQVIEIQNIFEKYATGEIVAPSTKAGIRRAQAEAARKAAELEAQKSQKRKAYDRIRKEIVAKKKEAAEKRREHKRYLEELSSKEEQHQKEHKIKKEAVEAYNRDHPIRYFLKEWGSAVFLVVAFLLALYLTKDNEHYFSIILVGAVPILIMLVLTAILWLASFISRAL